MELNPAATKASRISNDVGSSIVHPKTFPPSACGENFDPRNPQLALFHFTSFHSRAQNAPFSNLMLSAANYVHADVLFSVGK
jgi:hypothetical protein